MRPALHAASLVLLCGTALARSAAAAPATQVATPAIPDARDRAVIVPDRSVDPNMTVKAPHLPPRSTPVIRPRPTTPDGAVVVVPR